MKVFGENGFLNMGLCLTDGMIALFKSGQMDNAL